MWWRVLENISHICRIISTFRNFTGITFSHKTQHTDAKSTYSTWGILTEDIWFFFSNISDSCNSADSTKPVPLAYLSVGVLAWCLWSEARFSCHPHCLEQGFPQLGLKLGFSVVWKGWAGVCAIYLTNMSFVSTNEFVCNLIPPWFIGRGRTFQLQFIVMIRDLWSWI